MVFGQPANGLHRRRRRWNRPVSGAPAPREGGGRDLGDAESCQASRRSKGCRSNVRLTNAEGRTVYRTDIFSRQQIGRGTRTLWPSLDRRSGPPRRHQELQSDRQPGHSVTGVRRRPTGEIRHESPSKISGHTSSRPACRFPAVWRIWLSTSCTSARSVSASLGAGNLEDAIKPARSLDRTRRQCGRIAADVGVFRHAGLGLRRLTSLRHRVAARAVATSTSTSCARAIGAASRSFRMLSTTISIRTPIAREWAYDSDAPEREHLLLVRGTRRRLPHQPRGISGQRLVGLHATVLGGKRQAPVREQCGRLRRRIACRRLARGPDAGDSSRQRAACRRPQRRKCEPVRREDAARVEPHRCD